MNSITTYWNSLSPTTKRYIVTGVHVFVGTFFSTFLLDYKTIEFDPTNLDINAILALISTAGTVAVKALGEYVIGDYVSTPPTTGQSSN